jgi:hypothetical protein
MSDNPKTDANNPWMAFMNPGFLTQQMSQIGQINPAHLNPFAGFFPGAGAGGASDVNAWMKALDPAEIERRIQELRVVEMWLQTQVNMVGMSLQALSMQKQSMEAIQQATSSVKAAASAAQAAVTPAAKSTAKRVNRKR